MGRKNNRNASSPLAISAPELKIEGDLQLVESVTYNVHQSLIVVTHDKVELCLSRHVKTMEQRQAWVAPFGIFVSTLITLATATFQEVLHVSGATWKAMFIFCAVGSGIWLGITLLRMPRVKNIAQIIDELKSPSIQRVPTVRTEVIEATVETQVHAPEE